jgi:uncharacterized protein YjbJ (UPF0337 family)
MPGRVKSRAARLGQCVGMSLEPANLSVASVGLAGRRRSRLDSTLGGGAHPHLFGCGHRSSSAELSVSPLINEEEKQMPDSDEMKGRINEAAGDLTDNKDLQREGKIDQASGKAKDTIDKASDKAKDALDRDE